MKLSLQLLLITLLYGFSGAGQSSNYSKLGNKIDSLRLAPVLNHSSTNVELSELNDKVIILDFWATWCAPCIKAMPHLDSLQQKFGEDIQIFTITNSDSEERIEQFLEKFNTNLPIVIDSTLALKELFPHRVISHTVILGKDKRVMAITTPEKITEEVLNKILRGESPNLEEKKDILGFNYQETLPDNKTTKFFFKLTGYQEGAGGRMIHFNEKSGRLLFTNVDVVNFYRYARKDGSGEFNIPRVRFLENQACKTFLEATSDTESIFFVSAENFKSKAYSLEIVAPEKTESEVKKVLTQFLHANMDVLSRVKKTRTLVKILRKNGKKLGFEKSTLDSKKFKSTSGRGIDAQKVKLQAITEYMEGFGLVKVPVVDETNDENLYNIKLAFREEAPEQFFEELERRGLEVVDAEREIEVLVLYEEETKNVKTK